MADTAILDDLDAEALGLYCSQLAEREQLESDLAAARKVDEPDMNLILSLNKQINAKCPWARQREINRKQRQGPVRHDVGRLLSALPS